MRDLVEMRELLEHWDRQSSQSPVPQGLWAVEAADDGQLLGGAPLLPFSPRDPQLVMGWHLRPEVRGRGVAGQIGHALAHQAFLDSGVDEVFVAAPARNAGSLNVAKRLGMTVVDDFDWAHHGVQLEVLRMSRADLHKIRPGVSLDYSYDPDGLVSSTTAPDATSRRPLWTTIDGRVNGRLVPAATARSTSEVAGFSAS